jgi:hypothetical protein
MTAKELVQDFYKSDALIDSTIMKEYLHPDVSVEWNSSKGFVQLDYDGIVIYRVRDLCAIKDTD